MVASRHFHMDQALFARLQPVYEDYVKDQITKPPVRDQHHAVKALCLLCSWPLPVASTTDDMTFIHSGIMMKFAMQLGIHRPSSPSDFNNIPVSLRQDQVTDRLRTWAFCNIVAQHVSTSYGQPPETVWDSTLMPRAGEMPPALQNIEKRLRIEQEVDKITRAIYVDEMTPEAVARVKNDFNIATIGIGLSDSTRKLLLRGTRRDLTDISQLWKICTTQQRSSISTFKYSLRTTTRRHTKSPCSS